MDSLLGKWHRHNNHFVPIWFGWSPMLSPKYEDETNTKPWWHFLAVHIMCYCGVDRVPIYNKIQSHDPDALSKICAYFKVYRPWLFLNTGSQNSDFVAPLLGNRRCHGHHLCPSNIGHPRVSRKYKLHPTSDNHGNWFVPQQLWVGSHVATQTWNGYEHLVLSNAMFSSTCSIPVWRWPSTYLHRNWVNWLGFHFSDLKRHYLRGKDV